MGDPLTDREVQILSLVAAGEPTAAIGRRLGISANTVKSHLTNIYVKTGCRNRVQAARHYLRDYTTDRHSDPSRSHGAGGDSLIDEQIREIQARIDQLTPATTELERLEHALAALRTLQNR